MVCTNCGSGGDVEAYTVRFAGGGRDPTAMELDLCAACVAEFREESGVAVR